MSNDGTGAGRPTDLATAPQRHRTSATTTVVFHTISLIRIARDKKIKLIKVVL